MTKGNNKRNDYTIFQYFSCHKIGHLARNCPLKKEEYKRNNKRHHAHLVEDEEEEEEGPQRKQAKEEDAK